MYFYLIDGMQRHCAEDFRAKNVCPQNEGVKSQVK